MLELLVGGAAIIGFLSVFGGVLWFADKHAEGVIAFGFLLIFLGGAFMVGAGAFGHEVPDWPFGLVAVGIILCLLGMG